jgi:long-chain acyl-CoA synthetase
MSNESFPWFAKYPQGVAHEINPDKYRSITEILEESFAKFSDGDAFENMGKKLTYAQIDEYSQYFAAYLTNVAGLKKGDRIAIQMPNCLQYPIALFGALRAGLIVVNTNPLYTPREMLHQFKDSGSIAIVIMANFAHHLEEIIKDTPIKTVIVTELGDMLSGFKKTLVNFVVKRVKKMVPPFSLQGAIPFQETLNKGKQHEFVRPDLNLKDIAFLQYTGGTTGVSKGATLTHGNIVSNVQQCDEWFLDTNEGDELVVTALPLYHIFALTVNCFLMLKIGAHNVLITNPRDIPGFVKELKKVKMSVFTAVNTLFIGLMNNPEFSNVDFSKLKYTIGGGMAVQNFVADKWQEITGHPLAEGYGLSETSPLVTCNPLDGTERKGTIGLPAPSTEVAIKDEEGNNLPIGERGEICCRGPQVMPGYWQRPDETKDVFFDNWFRTGDIGIMDEDGFVKIVDRMKDMILVSGFNVYPNEVEDVIADLEAVLEVAVIGVPDEKSTEAVKAFVVKANDSCSEEKIIAHCKENLTGYKRPKHIEFIAEIPKSNVGKILRRMLRDH